MDVDLDEPKKGITRLMLKIMEYDVSLQPAYLSMGYPVFRQFPICLAMGGLIRNFIEP